METITPIYRGLVTKIHPQGVCGGKGEMNSKEQEIGNTGIYMGVREEMNRYLGGKGTIYKGVFPNIGEFSTDFDELSTLQ